MLIWGIYLNRVKVKLTALLLLGQEEMGTVEKGWETRDARILRIVDIRFAYCGF